MLDLYSTQVSNALLNCENDPCSSLFKKVYRKIKMGFASGSDQEELRNVFRKRAISHFFDAGIFGSPDDKFTIVGNLISKDDLLSHTLYRRFYLDYKVSTYFGMDFCQ